MLLAKLILVTLSVLAYAVPKPTDVVIEIEPNKEDWVYNLGEKVSFLVVVKSTNELSKDVEVNYTAGIE